MNPKEWDELVNQVRRQVKDVRSTLTQNSDTGQLQKETLQEAKHNIEQLMEKSSNPRESFYQLPLILQALTAQKLIGVFLIGNDGRVVMHHGSGQRLLGIDPVSNKLPAQWFFDTITGDQIEEGQLPWQRCLRGEEIPASVQLLMRDPDVSGDLHVEVSAIPLGNGEDVSGVVTLFRDITETIKADDYIKTLCNSLEKQLTGMEAAQRELKILADKLGAKNVTPAPTAPPVVKAAPTEAGTKLVLIVDDIPVNQKLLVMHMKKLGVDTEIANNGMEAVNACKCKRYSMVLMDLDMPILNGYEATAEIRKFETPIGLHTPIVAMTSFDRAADKYKCFKAGMDGFLAKGSSKDRLREIVGQYVFGKPAASPATIIVEPEPKQQINEEPRLDLEYLQETFGADFDNILSLFFGSASTLLNCLEFALDDKDAKQVTHFAFSLKGPCSSMGLGPMAAMSAQLAEDSMAEKWTEAGDKYKKLRRMFNTTKIQAGAIVEKQLLTSLREATDNASKQSTTL